MFYIHLFDLCCVTVIGNTKYRGFNQLTIDFLEVNEWSNGWFTVKRR